MAENSRAIVSITDYNKGDRVNVQMDKFAEFNADKAIQVLKDAGISSSAVAGNISLIDLNGDDAGGVKAFTYNDHTYLLAGTDATNFGNQEVLVELSGVQDADSLDEFFAS